MDLIIERLNGERFSFSENGIKTLDFIISSPSPITEIDKIQGRNGFIDFGTTYDGRTLSGSFLLNAETVERYALSRNKVFKILGSLEHFYLIDTRESDRRWLVKVASLFSLEQIMMFGKFSVSFASPASYAESIGTTLDAITFRNEPTIIDLDLQLTENDYVHTTNTFKVFNPGEKIDPRELPFKIHFTGASSNLSIKNNTNATEWIYNATTIDTDDVLLDGIRSFKNGISIFKDTNYGVIELNNGWNEFQINGATDFEIKFEHRFYYI